MGSFACELVRRTDGLALARGLDSADDLESALVPGWIGLDFTVAGRGFPHARLMLEKGVRPVIGTSGVSPAEVELLDTLARERNLGGRVVPNFSVGAWLLARLGKEAARLFPSCELVERHHEGKRDAPSGTARALAAELAPLVGHRVPTHSVRLPGHYAHHALLFGAEGERLSLRHDMSGPEAFAPGILFALELAAGDIGVTVGLPWEDRLRS